jgi:hypothetical protein
MGVGGCAKESPAWRGAKSKRSDVCGNSACLLPERNFEARLWHVVPANGSLVCLKANFLNGPVPVFQHGANRLDIAKLLVSAKKLLVRNPSHAMPASWSLEN